MRDFYNEYDSSRTINPQTRTTSLNGTGIDLRGYEGCGVVVLAGAYTDGTHAFTLEESDDDVTYSDAATADILGTEPTVSATAGQNKTYRFGYVGTKRYVRLVWTVTGGPATGLLAGGLILRAKKRSAPAAASA